MRNKNDYDTLAIRREEYAARAAEKARVDAEKARADRLAERDRGYYAAVERARALWGHDRGRARAELALGWRRSPGEYFPEDGAGTWALAVAKDGEDVCALTEWIAWQGVHRAEHHRAKWRAALAV